MKQAPWSLPDINKGVRTGLMVNNSLTGEDRVEFIPSNGRRVSWYICGPTVYDSSHLGHARNYMSFDVIRRILQDYFHFEVFSVMNITDVDDKIILKARRLHLYNEFISKHGEEPHSAEAITLIKAAWEEAKSAAQKKIAKLAEDKELSETVRVGETKLMEGKLAKIEAFLSDGSVEKAPLSASEDYLGIHLDNLHGASLKDLDVRPVAARYELEYLQDMEALGILPPDVLTRVSEYVEPIIEFVKKVMENKFGYESGGSVYFDTEAYMASPEHHYGKLSPEKIGNIRLLAEGEGSLTDARVEKRHPNDFVLWKNSKPGEPVWNSPWGLGRPGWHIECSAMAAELVGETLDVHSGGQDLKFPHHENEIAQCEAFFHGNGKPWVNYFFHSGHLDIEGLKMSKSLKNFISISDALNDFTARQLRLFFCTRKWDSKMNYERRSMVQVKQQETSFASFFAFVAHLLRTQMPIIQTLPQRWDQFDTELHGKLLEVQDQVDAAFKDNFDTRTVIFALLDLVNQAQVYFGAAETPKVLLVKKLADYVERILGVQGITGFGGGASSSAADGKRLHGVLDVLGQFRRDVREAAKRGAKAGEVLALTDVLRDASLPPLGVKLDDDTEILWHDIDAKQWRLEERQRKQAAVDKLAETITLRRTELSRAVEASKSPEDLLDKSLYSADEADWKNGVPQKGSDGEALPKGTIRSLGKQVKGHKNKHSKHLKRLEKSPRYIEELEETIEKLKSQMQQLTDELEKNQ